MKIDLNTIKWFLDFDLPPVDKLLEKIGAQLGEVEAVTELGKKYQGIVVAKVVSCDKHPDADKLHVCKIDDGGVVKDVERGSDGLVQVVCGAPNVREGLLVAWLPPGVTVPESVGKEPFVLEVRDIRGQKSNGMLASPKELALWDSHEGILELEGDHQPGTDFAEVFGLKDDYLIDIENKMFTHRPDCFGFMGVARELAGIQNQLFKSPDWYIVNPKFPAQEGSELKLEVKNELPKLVPRFTAIAISDVQVGPSPVWLQGYLATIGQKSINNIVDYTNWYMLETGQPLHAYDYDKVKALSDGEAAVITVRQPKASEKIKLLNGKEIEPGSADIMIASDKQLIGVGGVMGGSDTEVDADTKNIILECATFDMYAVRRTSMAHGLFTDAVTRFTKGQSPLQNLAVLARITEEICQHAGGQVASPVIDDNHLDKAVIDRGSLQAPVKVSAGFINDRLGLKLSADNIQHLLRNVEFKVDVVGEELVVTAPFWRTDIELPEDIVEEVGRLRGYDQLPLELPKRDLTPASKDSLLTLKSQIRQRLAKAGANEVLTYSFIHGDLLDKTGQDRAKAFQLSNALSPDLQYYRISPMPSLLDKVHANLRAGYDEFALFELSKMRNTDHIDDNEGLPSEMEFTALVVAAADKLHKAGAPYYQVRQFLTELAGLPLEFKPVGEDMQHYPVVQPYNLDRAALVNIKGGDFLGIIGEFKPSVSRALKLPKYCAGFELDTLVLQAAFDQANNYAPLPRFPKVLQDITLQVPAELSYQELFDFAEEELAKLQPKNTLPTLSPIDIYQKDDDAKHKNVTLRLSIASYERTLTDAEVNKLLDSLSAATKAKLDAERV